jgi:hypothetical protein
MVSLSIIDLLALSQDCTFVKKKKEEKTVILYALHEDSERYIIILHDCIDYCL